MSGGVDPLFKLRHPVIIGRGPWAQKISTALESLGVTAPMLGKTETEYFLSPPIGSFSGANGCDSVIIASEASTHAAIAKRILQATDLPIFIEKPMCTRVEDTYELAALVDQRVAASYPFPRVTVGHIQLWNRAYGELCADLANAVIEYIDIVDYGPGPRRGVSALWDYGPHAVSMLLNFMGPTAVDEMEYFAAAGSVDAYLLEGKYRGCEFTIAGGCDFSRKRRSISAKGKGHPWLYRNLLEVPESPNTPLEREMRGFLRRQCLNNEDVHFGAEVVRFLAAAEKHLAPRKKL